MRSLPQFLRDLSPGHRRVLAAAVGGTVVVLAAAGAVQLGRGSPATTSVAATTTTATSTVPPTSTLATSTTTTTVPPAAGMVWPLTGRPASIDPARVPILAVKIDNSPQGRPQAGLEDADLVFETPVEGGLVRLLALFQSQLPDEVGPVRSLREVDDDLLGPFQAAVAHSGGVAPVVEAVRRVAVDVGHLVLGEGVYRRDAARLPPYDLMVDPVLALAAAVERLPPAGLTLPFGDPAEEAEPALTVEIELSAAFSAVYRWSSGDVGWLRFNGQRPHVTESGDRLVAANVVVLYVPEVPTGRTDAAGSPVPDYRLLGVGEAVVFRDGFAVTGSWERGREQDVVRLFDEVGRPVFLGAGVTWVEVVPVGRNVVWQ